MVSAISLPPPPPPERLDFHNIEMDALPTSSTVQAVDKKSNSIFNMIQSRLPSRRPLSDYRFAAMSSLKIVYLTLSEITEMGNFIAFLLSFATSVASSSTQVAIAGSKTNVENFFKLIDAAVANVVTGLNQVINKLPQQLVEALNNVLHSIMQQYQEAITNSADNLVDALNKIAALLTILINNFISAIKNDVDQVNYGLNIANTACIPDLPFPGCIQGPHISLLPEPTTPSLILQSFGYPDIPFPAFSLPNITSQLPTIPLPETTLSLVQDQLNEFFGNADNAFLILNLASISFMALVITKMGFSIAAKYLEPIIEQQKRDGITPNPHHARLVTASKIISVALDPRSLLLIAGIGILASAFRVDVLTAAFFNNAQKSLEGAQIPIQAFNNITQGLCDNVLKMEGKTFTLINGDVNQALANATSVVNKVLTGTYQTIIGDVNSKLAEISANGFPINPISSQIPNIFSFSAVNLLNPIGINCTTLGLPTNLGNITAVIQPPLVTIATSVQNICTGAKFLGAALMFPWVANSLGKIVRKFVVLPD